MIEERLPTALWVEALIRRAQLEGAAAFVVQRGDRERGDIVLKIADLQGGAKVYVPRTSLEGTRVFVDLESQNVGPDEASADEYLQRAGSRGQDIWVIEIEDRAGRHFLTEPVENSS